VNLRQRLTRLEQSGVQASAPTYVWVVDEDRIGDDGTEAMRPWIGRTVGEVMATLSRDAALKVYGFDPTDRRQSAQGDDAQARTGDVQR
jgi:hypothetical protein